MKPTTSINQQVERARGFICGASEDGTLYTSPKKNAYIIEIEQNNKEWLLAIKKALIVAYNKKCNIDQKKSGYFRLSCYSKAILEDLQKIRKDYSMILRKSDSFKVGFLQGIYDAEGSVHKERLCIRIYSRKRALIELLKRLLAEMRITLGKEYLDKRNQVVMLPIYGKQNIVLFRERINFNHTPKNQLLNILLES